MSFSLTGVLGALFDAREGEQVHGIGVQMGLLCGNLELFKVLQSGDLEMSEYTMINVLSAIAGLRLLISGRQVQALCPKVGFLKVICVSNALMSMYGKCGGTYDARHVFDDMLHRVSVSWNSLTAGYSENGFSSQGLKCFLKCVIFHYGQMNILWLAFLKLFLRGKCRGIDEAKEILPC